jgi:hypothetical protein
MMITMRTTLDIDEDVLESAKELAARQGKTAGRVLSELARSALAPRDRSPRKLNGVPILPKRRGKQIVTPETVSNLRDEPLDCGLPAMSGATARSCV